MKKKFLMNERMANQNAAMNESGDEAKKPRFGYEYLDHTVNISFTFSKTSYEILPSLEKLRSVIFRLMFNCMHGEEI